MKKKFKSDKKGFFLAEETVKIIISIIVILFLAGFLFAIYYNYKIDSELENAKKSLQEFEKQTNAGATSFLINGLKNWQLLSYSKTQGELSVKFCSVLGWEECVCICRPGFLDIVATCEKKVFCIQSSLKINNFIELKDPAKLKIENGEVKQQ